MADSNQVWLILTIIFSFLLSFSIGANDAANALASSYGSKAIRVNYLIFMGGITIFIGAMFCSKNVAATLSTKIIPGTNELDEQLQNTMMFSVCATSFLFLLISSLFGMPISGTHTVVGSLLGAGIAAVGLEGVNWDKMIKIILSWFVSPVTAGLLAGIT